jgi:hypothetical protein
MTVVPETQAYSNMPYDAAYTSEGTPNPAYESSGGPPLVPLEA